MGSYSSLYSAREPELLELAPRQALVLPEPDRRAAAGQAEPVVAGKAATEARALSGLAPQAPDSARAAQHSKSAELALVATEEVTT